MTTTEKPETESEVATTDAEFWLNELDAAKDRMDDWYGKADEAEDRYKDCKQRPFGQLNIFWANVETQKAAIGEDFGTPQVTRVNQPTNDGGLSRHIANIWERAILAGVRDTNDNHDISLGVGDTFIAGRGQVWTELEVDDDGDPMAEENADYRMKDGEGNAVKWVRAAIVRIRFNDYLEGYATRWGDVPWVARRHLFTRDDLVKQCGLSEDEAADVPMNIQLPENRRRRKRKRRQSANAFLQTEQFKRAAVWEIWTKYPLKARIYVAEDYKDRILCVDPDPYRLKHFFPCPRPMLANGDEGWQEPLTDYSRYEDQAKELDRICTRIYVLTEVLRRRGIRDKQFKELADLAEVDDNVVLAVENWADLQQKGGLNKVVEYEDLAPVIVVLVELHKQRRELIQLIYELSGISDLARGMTDPDETLGAQRLKASFGAGRFKRREKESRRLAAEAYAIKGEVIAEHFPREQLAEMSGIPLPTRAEISEAKRKLGEIQALMQRVQQAKQQLAQLQAAAQQPQGQGQPAQQPAPPPNPQMLAQLNALAQVPPPNEEQVRYLKTIAETKFSWEQISKVLRSDYRRCYSVEVETDQTSFIDEESDKQAVTQLFQVAMQALQQLAPLIAGNPKVGEMYKRIFMFVLSRFRAGRAVEEEFDRIFDEAVQMAMQSQGKQQQDPKAAADAQTAQLKVQAAQISLKREEIGMQRDTIELQIAREKAGIDAQSKAIDAQHKAAEGERKVIEGQQKVAVQQAANQAKREGQIIDNINKTEQLQFERAQRATARETYLRDRWAPQPAQAS